MHWRVTQLESREKSKAVSDGSSESEFDDEDVTGDVLDTIMVKVRDTDPDQFYNRCNEKDGRYLIEVLLADDLWDDNEDRAWQAGMMSDAGKGDSAKREGSEDVIHRVRIQSRVILFLLCQACGAEWGGDRRLTFFRPFAWFIEAQNFMKEKLRELEQKFDGDSDAGRGSDTPPDPRASFSRVLSDSASGAPHFSKAERRASTVNALLNNPRTVDELRCYVDFVDGRILPLRQRYDNPRSRAGRNVLYSDLWYLFRPGELVYVPRENTSETSQFLYRVYTMWKPDAIWRDKDVYPYPRKDFELKMYSLDYDGEACRPITRKYKIDLFEGKCDVTTLDAYPLRYHHDCAKVMGEAEDWGRRFQETIKTGHMGYRGWTLVRDHNPKEHSDEERHTKYVESDVIVDFKEAFQSHPHWKPKMRQKTPQLEDPYWRLGRSKSHLIQWPDERRIDRPPAISDPVQSMDAITIIEYNRQIEKDKFLNWQKDPEFEGEDFMLLPKRVFAYVFRERRFCQLDARYLRKHETSDLSPFADLKIKKEHEQIIQSVVASHFRRKKLDENPEFAALMDQDLIRGKGRGLVILLHGAPGVGKTATAESVALWHKKPLFAITCGDLGFTPEGVESSLNDIFRLAHLWDCILLLDEADVFFSQREKADLHRNALVSVFLRVLEYYNGILFLTTNRVGVLDEAFKSRVHVSLWYPPLDREQTHDIMQINLARLKKIEEQRQKISKAKSLIIYEPEILDFAVQHWNSHSARNGQGRWNGRQIRNAVQIAASLAWYENKMDTTPGAEGLPPILRKQQFEAVEQTMSLFDNYFNKTRGGNDVDMSQSRMERYDRFSNQQSQKPGPVDASPSVNRGSSYQPYRQPTPQPSYPNNQSVEYSQLQNPPSLLYQSHQAQVSPTSAHYDMYAPGLANRQTSQQLHVPQAYGPDANTALPIHSNPPVSGISLSQPMAQDPFVPRQMPNVQPNPVTMGQAQALAPGLLDDRSQLQQPHPGLTNSMTWPVKP